MFKYNILLFLFRNKPKFFALLYSFFSLLKLDKNKVVFSNYSELGFGCNPKYIAQQILKNNPDKKIIWLCDKKHLKSDYPKGIIPVDINSFRAIFELCVSKIWVDNLNKIVQIRNGLIKRKGQYFVQTWHGSYGIKRIAGDVKSPIRNKNWYKEAFLNAQMQDFLLSNSHFETKIFQKAFFNQGQILLTGHARNDIFFKESTNIKEKIYTKYNIDKESKILLYVPTFRRNLSFKPYNMDYKGLKEVLEKKFGCKWTILIRLHRKIQGSISNQEDWLKNVSDYDDVQELLVISDACISDYSSTIFDFLHTQKPAFIYAFDLLDYDSQRGFYYSLSETPFPIAVTNQQLFNNILNFDYETYLYNIRKFFNEKGCEGIENGNSSKNAKILIENLQLDVLPKNEIKKVAIIGPFMKNPIIYKLQLECVQFYLKKYINKNKLKFLTYLANTFDQNEFLSTKQFKNYYDLLEKNSDIILCEKEKIPKYLKKFASKKIIFLTKELLNESTRATNWLYETEKNNIDDKIVGVELCCKKGIDLYIDLIKDLESKGQRWEFFTTNNIVKNWQFGFKILKELNKNTDNVFIKKIVDGNVKEFVKILSRYNVIYSDNETLNIIFCNLKRKNIYDNEIFSDYFNNFIKENIFFKN